MFNSQYAAHYPLCKLQHDLKLILTFIFEFPNKRIAHNSNTKKNTFDSQRLSYVRKNITAC